MTDDLQRQAEGLQDEIQRLRKELKAMQKAMRKKEQKAQKDQKTKAKRFVLRKERAEAKADDVIVEGQARLQEIMEERAEEVREEMEERREELEERREELREEMEERRGEIEERAEAMRHRSRERAEARSRRDLERQVERAVEASEEALRAKEHALKSAIKAESQAKNFFLEGKKWTHAEKLPGKKRVQAGVWFDGSKKGKAFPGTVRDEKSGRLVEGRLLKSPAGSAAGSGGSNTFHIHVEDGNVHIHTSGDPSITTSKRKPHAQNDEGKRFSAKIVTGNDATPTFAVKVNGQELDFENLGTDLGAFAVQGILSQVEGLEGVEIQGLKDLGSLQGNIGGWLEGLGGLTGIEVDADFDLDSDFDFDFEIDLEECDDVEEEIVEETTDEIVEEERDERFVRIRRFTSPPQAFRFPAAAPAAPHAQLPRSAHRLSGGSAALAPLATALVEEELLQLARDIQADVAAMRAELNELREEVKSAPRRR